jgi:4-oxalmesaconate hydratase
LRPSGSESNSRFAEGDRPARRRSARPRVRFRGKVVPADNILFASEMVGAVKGIDPNSGNYFDDSKRYVDNTPNLSAADKQKIFEGNALKVYPRLKAQIEKQARGNA